MSAVPQSEATPLFQPLYRQIAGLITRSLDGGEWQPGQAIPSELPKGIDAPVPSRWPAAISVPAAVERTLFVSTNRSVCADGSATT